VGVQNAPYSGHAGEATIHIPFLDYQEGLEENTDPEGEGRILAPVAGFVQNNALCSFERGGVVAVGENRGNEVEDEVQSH